MTKDWLGLDVEAAPDPRGHHLRTLRELLRRDYLARADEGYALRDLAQMAREAMRAAETLVALHDAGSNRWSAVASGGRELTDEEISRHASRSVLERVRERGAPVIAVDPGSPELSSKSVQLHRLESVLAVPLHRWDVTQPEPERQFAGCLYAHRTDADASFGPEEVELLLDLARIAEPVLNLLRHLQDVRKDLAASRERLEDLQSVAMREWRLGQYRTHDRWFAENVLVPLRRMAHARKVGLLLLGPTGSGKSHLAQAYHYECPRSRGPFVVLDCAQVTSEETLAAELFGYAQRSGFANAPPEGRPGAAELAQGGTLFIDEVGALPLELQQRLLALLQTGNVVRLGSSEKRHVDLQVIAATNEDLRELVQRRAFREDLFWRLGLVTIELPPLSERAADIPHLAEAFLRSACEQFDRDGLHGFTKRALAALLHHDWAQAGNIRGLEHTISRSVLLAPPEVRKLDAEHLRFGAMFDYARSRRPAAATPAQSRPPAAGPADARPPGPARDADAPAAARRSAGSDAELERLKRAIRQQRSASEAARTLGITRGTLVWQLRKAGLTVRDVLLEGPAEA